MKLISLSPFPFSGIGLINCHYFGGPGNRYLQVVLVLVVNQNLFCIALMSSAIFNRF